MSGHVGRTLHRAAGSRAVMRRRTSSWRIAVIGAALAITAMGFERTTVADEATTGAQIVELKVGFAGHFKVGYWTPVVVTVEAGSESLYGRVELVALDGDAALSRVVADEPLKVEPGQRAKRQLYVKIGQLKSDLTASFRTEGSGVVAMRHFAAGDPALAGIRPSGQELIVVVGLALTAPDEAQLVQHGAVVARLTSIDELPSDWWGFEGASIVLFAGDGQVASTLSTPSPQLTALATWVRMGGRLLLAVGVEAGEILLPGSPLAELAPGKFDSLVPLRRGTALEAYVDTNEPLSTAGPLDLRVPQLTGARGRIEAYEGLHPRDLPLVVRTPHGFGEVTFVAFDLGRPPLAEWKARPALFDRLLRRTVVDERKSEPESLGQVTTLGFVDIAGQLRGRSTSSRACGWCRSG